MGKKQGSGRPKKNSGRARKEAGEVVTQAQAAQEHADTRRFERHEVRHPLRAKCKTWSQFLTFYSRNLSKGGVFLAVDELPEVDTRIELQLDLPNGGQVVLLGRVAHAINKESAAAAGTQAGFGVEFDALTLEEEAALDSIIELAKRHEQAPPPPLRKP